MMLETPEATVRLFGDEMADLKNSGVTVHGVQLNVAFVPVGDMQWLALLKGQLGQNATAISLTFDKLTIHNKHTLSAKELRSFLGGKNAYSFDRRLKLKKKLNLAIDHLIKQPARDENADDWHARAVKYCSGTVDRECSPALPQYRLFVHRIGARRVGVAAD